MTLFLYKDTTPCIRAVENFIITDREIRLENLKLITKGVKKLNEIRIRFMKRRNVVLWEHCRTSKGDPSKVIPLEIIGKELKIIKDE